MRVDEERTRLARMHRLDTRIAHLQTAVTAAHDTSLAFNTELLREHAFFVAAKHLETKRILVALADAHIDLHHHLVALFDSLLIQLQRIRVS